MLNLTYLFCVYSVLGWIVEVVFFYLKTGKFHSRGILNGTYCPLYGFSLAVCTILTYNTINKFIFSFFICAFICTSFELITGIIFDKFLNHKMWEYKEQKINFGGYICLAFAVIWGIIATLCIKYLNPFLLSVNESTKAALTIALIAFMIADIFSFVKTH